MVLKRLFSRARQASSVRSMYEAIVAQARQPQLYADLGVPDTLDGRYDMIILHADAVAVRLQAGEEVDKTFTQELMEELFRDMDRSLREMGVGDMGIGKRVKKMATVFYGRADAYARAREEGGTALSEALLRNVYAGQEAMRDNSEALAGYAMELHKALEAQTPSDLRINGPQWPAAETLQT